MNDESILELLELYMDMVEKQDDVIRQMGKLLSRMATDLQLLKNDKEFSDVKLEEDLAATKEAIGQYDNSMREINI